MAGLLTSHEAAGRTTHQSNALFSWLFKACLAYQLYEWLRVRCLLKTFVCTCKLCEMSTVELTLLLGLLLPQLMQQHSNIAVICHGLQPPPP